MISNRSPWLVTFITLYPEIFPGFLNTSLSGKAKDEGIWDFNTVNIRNYGIGKHKTVDDTPFGGGAGMILKADVISKAIETTQEITPARPLIYMTPRGKQLTQKRVKQLSQGAGAIILCGRFETIDQRVVDYYNPEEISIGDYILSGGEQAAMILVDSCLRLLPKVMNNEASDEEESFVNNLLEYPQYTKPQIWHNLEVPPVLLSGNHKEIANWRLKKAQVLTKIRRPDLWQLYNKH